MIKIVITLTTLFLPFIECHAQSIDIGCASSILEGKEECSQENILQDKSFVLNNLVGDNENHTLIGKVKIREELDSVKIIYQKKEFLIERIQNIKERTCPPHCIQAMYIANVKTIGELETLKFIESLKAKKGTILVDARTTKWYKKSTIPGATNIPYTMLSKTSKHREKVLQLLGGKKLQKKWYFKNIQKLLIFDSGAWDNQATKIIENLIEVGYPQKKILYYRGGIQSWRELGLTLL